MIAEITVPEKYAVVFKKDTRRIVQLNIRKNLLGTLLAGGVRSANAHVAICFLILFSDRTGCSQHCGGFTGDRMLR